MSFYIGQYIGNSFNGENVPYEISTVSTNIDYLEGTYSDTCINTELAVGSFYYLQVEITREAGATGKERIITIQLQGDAIAAENNQKIETVILPKATADYEKSTYNFIINPIRSGFTKIGFILSRNLKELDEWDASATIKVKVFSKLSNLCGENSAIPISGGRITQLGVHAAPGTLMCINGEPLRVGKRGVFELNDTSVVEISFLNIISNETYMIDYRYTTEEVIE